MCTATLSIISLITIIWMILCSHLKLSTTCHRMMFGLVFCNIFWSLFLTLSSIPIPKGTSGVLYAIGNQATCNMQGIIGTFWAASSSLNFCGLTGCFLLAIKFELSDEALRKYYEPFVHILPFLYGLVGAIVTKIYTEFFVYTNVCWIAPKPLYLLKYTDFR